MAESKTYMNTHALSSRWSTARFFPEVGVVVFDWSFHIFLLLETWGDRLTVDISFTGQRLCNRSGGQVWGDSVTSISIFLWHTHTHTQTRSLCLTGRWMEVTDVHTTCSCCVWVCVCERSAARVQRRLERFSGWRSLTYQWQILVKNYSILMWFHSVFFVTNNFSCVLVRKKEIQAFTVKLSLVSDCLLG